VQWQNFVKFHCYSKFIQLQFMYYFFLLSGHHTRHIFSLNWLHMLVHFSLTHIHTLWVIAKTTITCCLKMHHILLISMWSIDVHNIGMLSLSTLNQDIFNIYIYFIFFTFYSFWKIGQINNVLCYILWIQELAEHINTYTYINLISFFSPTFFQKISKTW
jgi:hypothetical protein